MRPYLSFHSLAVLTNNRRLSERTPLLIASRWTSSHCNSNITRLTVACAARGGRARGQSNIGPKSLPCRLRDSKSRNFPVCLQVSALPYSIPAERRSNDPADISTVRSRLLFMKNQFGRGLFSTCCQSGFRCQQRPLEPALNRSKITTFVSFRSRRRLKPRRTLPWYTCLGPFIVGLAHPDPDLQVGWRQMEPGRSYQKRFVNSWQRCRPEESL